MRTLLALFLILPLTVQGQAIWRNFFVTNQNPRVTVVAGSNATVQASLVGVDQRIFTVNAIPGGTVNTNDLNGWLSTNVAGFAGYATNAGFATNATYALWGTNSFFVLTAILTNQVYGSNVVGAVPEATHATNADNASNSTNFWGVLAPTNLPPGLSTSNYVGTFTGNGAGITNMPVTNLAAPAIIVWSGPTNNLLLGYPYIKTTYVLTSDASITNVLGVTAGYPSEGIFVATNSSPSNCTLRLPAQFISYGSAITNNAFAIPSGKKGIVSVLSGNGTNWAAALQP